jgi:HEAT repeats
MGRFMMTSTAPSLRRRPADGGRAANTLSHLADRLNQQGRRAAETALGAASRPDENGLVRAYATAALLAVGCADAVPIAPAALQDKDWDVRTFVASELGQVQGARIVDALIPLLQDREAWVREAADSLGSRTDPRALPPLCWLSPPVTEHVNEPVLRDILPAGACAPYRHRAVPLGRSALRAHRTWAGTMSHAGRHAIVRYGY